MLEISAVDSIGFTSYQHRRDNLRDRDSMGTIEVDVNGEESMLNKIDVIPRKV